MRRDRPRAPRAGRLILQALLVLVALGLLALAIWSNREQVREVLSRPINGPLFALAERAAAGRLALAELVGLLWHCRHNAPPALDRAAFGEAVVAGGLAGALPLNSSHAPAICRSFCTRSVGWAPWRSQCTARSLSTLMADGSARGS